MDHTKLIRSLSPAMQEVLTFLYDITFDAPTEGFNQHTVRALRQRELIEPSTFTPCCPVPLPATWRITQLGRDVVGVIRKR